MLDKTTISRLSFIKYLYNFAAEQSYKGEPFCAISILLFHDAIELFNQIALEYKDIKSGKEKLAFLDPWGYLDLTQKECMKRLNNARIALKHHGNIPSRLMIESYRACATNFFEDNTLTIFNVHFNEISLIDVIQDVEAREYLKEAEYHLTEKHINESITKSGLSFSKLMRNFAIKGLKVGEFLRVPRSSDLGISPLHYGKIQTHIKKTIDAISSIQNTLKYLMLGINYRKYVRFQSIIPIINWTLSGEPTIYFRNNEVSFDDAKFCVDFVIETAVSLQNQ